MLLILVTEYKYILCIFHFFVNNVTNSPGMLPQVVNCMKNGFPNTTLQY